MSYETYIKGKEIDVKIPLKEIPWLIDNSWELVFITNSMDFNVKDVMIDYLEGHIVDNEIILNKEQSSPDGIGWREVDICHLMRKFNGSGVVEEIGEEPGDKEFYKFKNGEQKTGRVVFD